MYAHNQVTDFIAAGIGELPFMAQGYSIRKRQF